MGFGLLDSIQSIKLFNLTDQSHFALAALPTTFSFQLPTLFSAIPSIFFLLLSIFSPLFLV
jgi:hypothetical protein